METRRLDRLEDLNQFLADNRAYVNGKNFRVKDLHQTVADSSHDEENLLGIYLAQPASAAMAAWMAVTNRRYLKRWQLNSVHLDTGDRLGRLVLHESALAVPTSTYTVDEAYLYGFNPPLFNEMVVHDVRSYNGVAKLDQLRLQGYHWDTHPRHGKRQRAYVTDSATPEFILIDAWQVAIVNVPRLVPSFEVVLTNQLIRELRKRIRVTEVPLPTNPALARPS